LKTFNTIGYICMSNGMINNATILYFCFCLFFRTSPLLSLSLYTEHCTARDIIFLTGLEIGQQMANKLTILHTLTEKQTCFWDRPNQDINYFFLKCPNGLYMLRWGGWGEGGPMIFYLISYSSDLASINNIPPIHTQVAELIQIVQCIHFNVK
jgi:hypothetical protein